MKKIIDYSLISKEIDLSKIKILQIHCLFCEKVAYIKISNTIEMTQELMDYMENELKNWQKNHCKQKIK